MFLKHRHGLGDEPLCREVADSITWQRRCRIPLGGRVPHPTTLVNLTRRLGQQTVERLNQALLAQAAGGASRTQVRDRRWAARRRVHEVARAMRSRTDQVKQVVFEVTGQVTSLASRSGLLRRLQVGGSPPPARALGLAEGGELADADQVVGTVPSERFMARRCRSKEWLRLKGPSLFMAGPWRSDELSIRYAASPVGRQGRLD